MLSMLRENSSFFLELPNPQASIHPGFRYNLIFLAGIEAQGGLPAEMPFVKSCVPGPRT